MLSTVRMSSDVRMICSAIHGLPQPLGETKRFVRSALANLKRVSCSLRFDSLRCIARRRFENIHIIPIAILILALKLQ